MSQRDHPTSAPVIDALTILGLQIAAGRRDRRWTAADLADRAGISPRTLRNVERGLPSVSIGIVFEVAVLVGIPLYGASDDELRDVRRRAADRLALLPQRVRESASEAVNDDF
ncbi:DNA-binding XRE family transcriptional regulator [Rhodoglobus vestalii]|uniref:DNA-binding XRE family transcriptional regulator n=1 Tax=Rhodoglobus vestalii TaxID=193384 RepID=A0A8H2K9K3_9MICO|nr:helix-turn-helix transcriptional regulator [Rhodoglobus vestalii]TQO21139.1 DNA-binding XRE family transcriptional regulator [Rhodoglobus vestalii]